MTLTPRPAVRVMLIDQDFRILLLKGRDFTLTDAQPWWFTVGGGIRRHETPTQALRREVMEETGYLITELLETPFSRTFSFIFEGRPHFQHETFYMALSPTFEPDAKRFTAIERRSIIGYKWWTLQELQQTRETIYPAQLASWLEFLVKSRLSR